MVDLYRIVAALVVGVLLSGFAELLRAETIPATPSWKYSRASFLSSSYYSGAPSSGTAAAILATCSDSIGNWNCATQAPIECHVTIAESGSGAGGCGGGFWQVGMACTYHPIPDPPPPSPQSWTGLTVCTTAVSNQCPVGGNWTLSGSNCTRPDCPAGQSYVGAVCMTTCPTAGASGPSLGIPAASSPGSEICWNSCKYTYTTASNQYQSGGNQIWYGGTSAVGTNCTGGEVGGSNPSTAPPGCPSGQVPGTINGAFACLPSSDASPAKQTTSQTTTTTNAGGSPTGSTTTTTTQTTGGGGTTTTETTTTRDAGGAVTGGATTTTNKPPATNEVSDFCKINPTSPMCKISTWGGACGGFTCDGDAVQCAVANEIYKRNCTLFDTPNTEGTLYGDIKAGNDPAKSSFPNDPGKLETKSFSGAISQTPWLASGTLQDFSFDAMGQSITVPMSRWNAILNACGLLLVGFSLVAAARIVVGGA